MELRLDRLILLTAVLAFLVCASPALGGSCDARGDTYAAALKAKAEARARAARALATARDLAAERARERRWVRRWTGAYGPAVGRWADDALRSGWPGRQMWTLGRIIRAESGGAPAAYNASGCAGLLQLAPYWYRDKWRFDPFRPGLNLRYGLRVWRLCGWRCWATY